MSKYAIEDSTLIAIGDAIRKKAGTTNSMTPSEMVTAIGNITGGGGGTGGSSSRWESPEGGWTYGTSPWHGYYITGNSSIYDYWNFDVTDCNELTLTLVYLHGASTATGYLNSVSYTPHYGYLHEYGSNDKAYLLTTQIDSNATSGTSTNIINYKGVKQVVTITLDVSNYTIVALDLELYSYNYSSKCALYIQDIAYN